MSVPAPACDKLDHAEDAASDSGIPLIAAIFPKTALTAPYIVEFVADFDAHHVFGMLVAEMALDAQTQRRAMGDFEILLDPASREGPGPPRDE